jgi:hypothetical protein
VTDDNVRYIVESIKEAIVKSWRIFLLSDLAALCVTN